MNIDELYKEALVDLTIPGQQGNDFARMNHKECLIFFRIGEDLPHWDKKWNAKTFLISKTTFERYMRFKKNRNIVLATYADELLNLGMDAVRNKI